MLLRTPQHPWSHLALDFLTGLSEFNGYTMILVVQDQFSCSLHLISVPGLSLAMELTELLFNHVSGTLAT